MQKCFFNLNYYKNSKVSNFKNKLFSFKKRILGLGGDRWFQKKAYF